MSLETDTSRGFLAHVVTILAASDVPLLKIAEALEDVAREVRKVRR